MIEGITAVDDEPKIAKLEDYYITAKYYLNKWNIRKMSKSNEIIKENLKNFSIGNIMQLKPLSFEENRESTIDLENWLENAYEEKNKTEMFRAETYEKILLKVSPALFRFVKTKITKIRDEIFYMKWKLKNKPLPKSLV